MRLSSTLPTLLLAALMATSCGDNGPSGSEIVTRELPESQQSFRLVDSSAERFRYQKRDAAAPAASSQASSAPELIYTTPEGWEEKAGSMMRDVNLSFGENDEGECYVARLPGAGGGLVANVNRWLGQMGADSLTEEEINALPKKPLFGQPATFIDVTGDFSPGMGSSEVKKNHRLLGLILASDAGAVFVKMTGPEKLVAENADGFDVFTSSLDVSLN
ncbi:MAG: hypothetical protein P1U81_11840 [Verrucomicrobiales bacterium]|jgi:hypothetical protein|nr:hypothetical protein [Verrucomicrobiales bacterium]